MPAEVGQAAPEFTLPAHTPQGQQNVSLSQFKGQKHVVLSFHVFDFTGTWCDQVSSFRMANRRFEEKNAQVLGISTDSVHSHRVFSNSMGNIPYPLLSDFHPKGQVAQAFGIWNADRGTSLRAVIIVDKNGIVRYKRTWTQGFPDPNEILKEVEKLEA